MIYVSYLYHDSRYLLGTNSKKYKLVSHLRIIDGHLFDFFHSTHAVVRGLLRHCEVMILYINEGTKLQQLIMEEGIRYSIVHNIDIFVFNPKNNPLPSELDDAEYQVYDKFADIKSGLEIDDVVLLPYRPISYDEFKFHINLIYNPKLFGNSQYDFEKLFATVEITEDIADIHLVRGGGNFKEMMKSDYKILKKHNINHNEVGLLLMYLLKLLNMSEINRQESYDIDFEPVNHISNPIKYLKIGNIIYGLLSKKKHINSRTKDMFYRSKSGILQNDRYEIGKFMFENNTNLVHVNSIKITTELIYHIYMYGYFNHKWINQPLNVEEILDFIEDNELRSIHLKNK